MDKSNFHEKQREGSKIIPGARWENTTTNACKSPMKRELGNHHTDLKMNAKKKQRGLLGSVVTAWAVPAKSQVPAAWPFF